MEIRFVLLLAYTVSFLVLITSRDVKINNALVRINCTFARHKRNNWKNAYYNNNNNNDKNKGQNYNLCVYQIPTRCRYQTCVNHRHRISTYKPKIVYPVYKDDVRRPVYSGPAKNWFGPKFGKM